MKANVCLRRFIVALVGSCECAKESFKAVYEPLRSGVDGKVPSSSHRRKNLFYA